MNAQQSVTRKRVCASAGQTIGTKPAANNCNTDLRRDLTPLLSNNSDVLSQLLEYLEYSDTVMLSCTGMLLHTSIRDVATFAHLDPSKLPNVYTHDGTRWAQVMDRWPCANTNIKHHQPQDEPDVVEAVRNLSWLYNGECSLPTSQLLAISPALCTVGTCRMLTTAFAAGRPVMST
jgi:hypothetical protein